MHEDGEAGCVQMSDLFNYERLNKPTFVRNMTCAGLGRGFEHLGTDPIFPGFELYYVGGRAGFDAQYKPWLAAHPDMGTFLGALRDANPACRMSL